MSENPSPRCGSVLLILAISVSFSCRRGDGGGSPATDVKLVRTEAARLVDVFGLVRVKPVGHRMTLFERDVIAGPNIQGGNGKYEFVGRDSDSLQPRLLIRSEIGTAAFQEAFDALDREAQRISPASYGQDPTNLPFTVVPRNAAIRLRFDRPLGLAEDFFVRRGGDGNDVAFVNTEAVQLLEILDDPTVKDSSENFRSIPLRIVVKGDSILLDPVLVGREGIELGFQRNALGMPESQDSRTANIRLALALEGPLRIPGLATPSLLVGRDLALRRAVIRDFRSGNDADVNQWISRGFLREAEPPLLVGEMAMRFEAMGAAQRIKLYKAGLEHEIDRGDVLCLYLPGGAEPVATTLVVTDPEDDRGAPGVQHVLVEVEDASLFARYDPSLRKDYPIPLDLREAWLLEHAPIAVLAAEFDGSKGDDLRNFVRFSPVPSPATEAQRALHPDAVHNVSPFASVSLSFSEPVDMRTVKPYESMILATHGDTVRVLDAKLGTPYLITAQRFDEDGSQIHVRLEPPFGFHLDPALRKQNLPYFLHIIGGLSGIRDPSGNPLDLGFANGTRERVRVPFYLDVRSTGGEPRFPDNRVVSVVRRMRAKDEDESPAGMQDYFGAISLVAGRAVGRPTTRSSSYVDDRNQMASPPDPPFRFCLAGQTMLLTGATPFTAGVQNPLNPWGCRLQTLWREIDLSLSRTDPFDFNLDIERMWWAPFQGTPAAKSRRIIFDIFDYVQLSLGHSERRPSNCAGNSTALPVYRWSGLRLQFYHNYLRSLLQEATSPTEPAQIDERPAPHLAFLGQTLYIRDQDVVRDPTGVNRFLPYPSFEKPYFTWRDERLALLGGGSGLPTILSPFKSRFWNGSRSTPIPEDGEVGSIALPLLADFEVHPDDPAKPLDNPWFAIGSNGLQASLGVASSLVPNQTWPFFRVYSAGGLIQGRKNPKIMNPTMPGWKLAQGGWNFGSGLNTPPGDANTYWIRVDYLKRISVMTYGFLQLDDPHDDERHDYGDPRLGKYDLNGVLPRFAVAVDPLPADQPPGTRVMIEYRAGQEPASTFEAFDPLVAGEAHVRYFDNATRKWRSYQHTRRLTGYTRDVTDLFDAGFLERYDMRPEDIRLLNFRFVFENNVDSDPPRTPALDSFSFAYRLRSAR
ncbi:MAG: hypothetical protein ACE5F1_05760 [Planctomycetota bacterium]